jgi:hypothetical protein
MFEKPSKRKLEKQAAADLIDRNVSFDFNSFLTKLGPARSFSEPDKVNKAERICLQDSSTEVDTKWLGKV